MQIGSDNIDAIRRIPPFSKDAEEAVIGSILLDPDCIQEVALIIEPKDFYFPENNAVFEAMLNIAKKGEEIELVKLTNELKNQDILEQIGGAKHLFELANITPTSAHVKSHAKIIKQKSFQRESIKYANNIIANAYGSFENTINSMNEQPSIDMNKNRHKSTSELMQINIDDVARRYNSKEGLRGMTTGFYHLDNLTDGIKGAEVIGLYAESNAGKSILASDIARHISKKYGSVAFFAYEMLAEDISYRMLPDETSLKINHFNKPKKYVNARNINKIKDYEVDKLDRIHIFADELTQKTAHEIDCKISLIPNLKLIIVDYLHLMKAMEKSEDINKYTNILREIKRVNIKYRVPVLVLMSQTKSGEFRGTEELKHDVDQLWELKRDGESSDKEVRQDAKLYIKKGRNNIKGKIDLLYLEDYLTFKNR